MRPRDLLPCLLALALGCAGEDFEPPSRVNGPRLLAVVATPPVVAPGDDVRLVPFAAGPDGAADVTVAFEVDLSPRALATAAGQESLFDEGDPIALEPDGDGAVLDGADTEAAIERVLALVGDAGPGTDEHVVRLVYETVGLVLRVRVTMRDAEGEVLVEGFKRVLLMPEPEAADNPPPPRVRVGETWLSARGAGDPFRCAPEAAGAPEVAAGAEVTFAPEPDEGWLETYPALDLDGRLVEGTENAYYSWFATGGDFTLDVTRAPDREVTWTAPDAAGTVPFWLVVRDGHLGTSACRAEVSVVAP
ncbi:MAG TPA: hypothetical protein RMH99_11030 [Sandaracinaceae bacterium LLY-WYZ-13_1]|nr:hypothetical protein [Sandaracinaceae bacterium LLY-WYZ-13_1]